MTSTDFETAPRFHIPVALALLTLLGLMNIASAAAMLFGQG